MKQPTALRLADELDHGHALYAYQVDAAAELRRLHALNAELMEALKGLVGWFDDDRMNGAEKHIKKARAAIAKATGEV